VCDVRPFKPVADEPPATSSSATPSWCSRFSGSLPLSSAGLPKPAATTGSGADRSSSHTEREAPDSALSAAVRAHIVATVTTRRLSPPST
jgi:hypothetical protein